MLSQARQMLWSARAEAPLRYVGIIRMAQVAARGAALRRLNGIARDEYAADGVKLRGLVEGTSHSALHAATVMSVLFFIACSAALRYNRYAGVASRHRQLYYSCYD